MNEERNNASPPANIGISLLLVVFLILCLFTFSAIALVQAENEWHQAELTKSSRDAYYAAANEAEADLAELNRQVADLAVIEADTAESDADDIAADDTDSDEPTADDTSETDEADLGETDAEGAGAADMPEKKISRQYDISDIQALSVVFRYDEDASVYRFSEFKTVSTKEWEGDDTVNVIR